MELSFPRALLADKRGLLLDCCISCFVASLAQVSFLLTFLRRISLVESCLILAFSTSDMCLTPFISARCLLSAAGGSYHIFVCLSLSCTGELGAETVIYSDLSEGSSESSSGAQGPCFHFHPVANQVYVHPSWMSTHLELIHIRLPEVGSDRTGKFTAYLLHKIGNQCEIKGVGDKVC